MILSTMCYGGIWLDIRTKRCVKKMIGQIDLFSWIEMRFTGWQNVYTHTYMYSYNVEIICVAFIQNHIPHCSCVVVVNINVHHNMVIVFHNNNKKEFHMVVEFVFLQKKKEKIHSFIPFYPFRLGFFFWN